jgi:flavorubredoxin
MKKISKVFFIILSIILFIWFVLTLWVENEASPRSTQMGDISAQHSALIVYDPDPLYNLDQQVCESFARGLVENGWKVTVASVASAKEINQPDFQLYVFCANTYNWSPDRVITRFIKNQNAITNQNVVAITVGSGSTDQSKKVFENTIKNRKAKLIDSKSFWLLRPNHPARMKESNVKVADDMARQWASDIAKRLIN